MKALKLLPLLAVTARIGFMAQTAAPPLANVETGDVCFNMDLSPLMQVGITSVSKKPQNPADTAAAYVITYKDIRWSGVTSIQRGPGPGIQVARISAGRWLYLPGFKLLSVIRPCRTCPNV
jgi:hypothetical protein